MGERIQRGKDLRKMEITFIGIIVIILSIIAFIKDEDWLLGLVIFLSTFVAAQAIDIKVTTTAIVPFEIPLVLWILKQVINFITLRQKHNIFFFYAANKEYHHCVNDTCKNYCAK